MASTFVCVPDAYSWFAIPQVHIHVEACFHTYSSSYGSGWRVFGLDEQSGYVSSTKSRHNLLGTALLPTFISAPKQPTEMNGVHALAVPDVV